jgi:hypothetical protein
MFPPGAVETRDEASPHWVCDVDNDDRDALGRLLGRESRRVASGGHDEVDLEPYELGREPRQAIELGLGRAPLDYEILSLYVSEFAQALTEGLHAGFDRGQGGSGEEADHRPSGLLRSRG